MGSSELRKSVSVLMICGDFMEDYEASVPFYFLRAFGITVDCISPGKLSGEKCFTAVHDFLGFEMYTELTGHSFKLNASFNEVVVDNYDALIIPGGRFVEPLSVDEKVVEMIIEFHKAGKVIVTSCHSQLLLASAGLLKGKKCTAFPSLKPVVELAGGVWWEQEGVDSVLDITECVRDGNVISSIGWPVHGHYLNVLLDSIGARITGSGSISAIFLCGDYVDDYEINVPFRALQAFGCKVDIVTPSKKKGENCVSAIYDDVGALVCKEKRGHNIPITKDWKDVNVEDYNCLVLPGGRSPELLVMNDSVVELVKTFANNGKTIGSIGNGHWILSAAGVLKGKRCVSNCAMEVIVKVGGGEVVKGLDGCVSDGNLVTAAGWDYLSGFVYQLTQILGLSVVF